MDIARMSMALSQMKVSQQASISVLKMSMDSGESKMNDMVHMIEQTTRMMEQSVIPNLGNNIDIKG